MDRQEPQPAEALAELPEASVRGTLKVYMGAAVGVGKTYRMLEEAHLLRREGHDVVLGFVETHGRAATAALIGDLEAVPLREVPYRGVVLKEMDIEAILSRKPQFVIVDELAHTNVPGSRNSKRYDDVRELLAARINVITALNIQHVESLTPIVRRLTGVGVHETIPDGFLALADEVVDVDVSTDELRERLREGKIYPIQQVNLALRNFFRPSNIGALRELTLREVAREIGRGREEHGACAVDGVQAAGERLLVCLPSDPDLAEGLLCKAWREASSHGAPWYALHVETPQESLQKISSKDFRALLDNVNLATDLQAEIVWFQSSDVVRAIIDFAHEKKIAKIILNRSHASFWGGLHHHSAAERLFHEARDFDVEFVRDES